MLLYPVDLDVQDDGVTAIVPDLGAVTEGDDVAQALDRARDAACTVLAAMMADRRPIPAPSDPAGRPAVRMPLLTSLKIRLYEAMQARGVSQSDLARRLGRTPKDVFRLLDLDHASRMDQIEAAFAALDLVIDADIHAAA